MNKRSFLKTGIFSLGALALSKKTMALEYYPMPSDKKWAVLYGTWCGTARDAGIWISEGMDGIANVFDVRENPDLSGYQHVIIGGAIRANKTSQELQDYLTKNKELLKTKIRGYYAVCGNMMKPVEPAQSKVFFEDHLAQICGVTNVPAKAFLGRITFGLMEPEVRKQMQAMAGMAEYDNLKRVECMAFGKEILTSVK